MEYYNVFTKYDMAFAIDILNKILTICNYIYTNITKNIFIFSWDVLDNVIVNNTNILQLSDKKELNTKEFTAKYELVKEQYEIFQTHNPRYLAYLFEVINMAARVIIRLKPLKIDNTAPIISKQSVRDYTIRDYLGTFGGQSGGYKNYNDIIKFDSNNKILIDKTICALDEKYGPFSAFYPPQYNNFDIYKQYNHHQNKI